jgi:hypothetical protein
VPFRQSRTALSSQPAAPLHAGEAFRRRSPLQLVASLLGAAIWLVGPPRAHAYEDQQTLGVGIGYANALSITLPAHGVCVDLSASSGLSATWTARARLTYAWHPDPAPLHVGMAVAELLYVIDVLEWVPYFGAGAGVVGQVRENALTAYPSAHAVAGVDYLLSRGLALELDVRSQVLLSALRTHPLYLAATLAVVWLLDP